MTSLSLVRDTTLKATSSLSTPTPPQTPVALSNAREGIATMEIRRRRKRAAAAVVCCALVGLVGCARAKPLSDPLVKDAPDTTNKFLSRAAFRDEPNAPCVPVARFRRDLLVS